MKLETIRETIATHIRNDDAYRIAVSKFVGWYESADRDVWRGQGLPGAVGSDFEDIVDTIKTNYTYSFVDTLTATVCPSNPQVTVEAQETAHEAFAKTRERLVNYEMRRSGMGDKLKEAAAWCAMAQVGIMKTVWHIPSARPRVHVVDPQRFFYDLSNDWDEIRYCCEATLLPEEEFRQRVKDGIYPESAAKVNGTARPSWLRTDDPSNIADTFRWVLVYEFYDFTEDRFYHLLDGQEGEPLVSSGLPYQYVRNPYSRLLFNKSYRGRRGVSDIQLIANDQIAMDQCDHLELLHGFKSIPGALVDETSVDDPASLKEAIQNTTEPGALISTKVAQGYRVTDVLAPMPVPSLPSTISRTRDRSRENIMLTLALSDYQRGQVGEGELATELALADEALKNRQGMRSKRVLEVVTDIARKMIGLYRQFLGPGQTITVRDDDGRSMVDRESLGFRDGMTPADAETESWFEFDALPYSPAENNRLVRLKSLQQWSPMLLQSPYVDQRRIVGTVLELLGVNDAMIDPTTQQVPAVPPGANIAGGGANTAAPTDTPATGGMPTTMQGAELDPMIPPAGTADQPKVKL